jgi:uncharacterized protein YjbI with pentapeptide repeats
MAKLSPKEKMIGCLVATWWGWLVVILAVFLLVAVFAVLVWAGYLETGFVDYTSPTGEFQRGKTLWDWMDLLLVPIVLAGLVAWFSWETNKRERSAEDRRLEEQRKIELDRLRQTALQTYLDRMTELLLKEGLRAPEPDAEVRDAARAQTLTVLPQLDGVRKSRLLSFLYESGLIGRQEVSVDLSGADLSEAHLQRANLSEAYLGLTNLYKTNLVRADLSGTNLRGAYLVESTLEGVNLRSATLREAHLGEVNLKEADLSKADLRWASMSMADLQGARLDKANLRGANLTGAKVTPEQLAQAASLEGATLPDGTESISKPKSKPASTEPGAKSAREQPDQPGDFDAGDDDQEIAK